MSICLGTMRLLIAFAVGQKIKTYRLVIVSLKFVTSVVIGPQIAGSVGRFSGVRGDWKRQGTSSFHHDAAFTDYRDCRGIAGRLGRAVRLRFSGER